MNINCNITFLDINNFTIKNEGTVKACKLGTRQNGSPDYSATPVGKINSLSNLK